jgi:hypothetical protein
MSLVFNNPASPAPAPKQPSDKPEGNPMPGKPADKPLSPMDQIKQRRKDQILKQKKDLDRQLKNITMARKILSNRLVEAQEPEDLFTQIRPELVRMKIPTNKVVLQKMKLTEKNVAPKMSLYYILLRRDTTFDLNMIRGIYSQSKNFNMITWNAQGPELWLWYPYKPPADAEEVAPPPGTPKAPGGVGL